LNANQQLDAPAHQSASQELTLARNKRHLEPKLKKEEIELVAMELLKTKGYDNTSMAEIARSAGVAANTIYWYFENKDDVLIAVLNRVVSQAIAEMATLSEQTFRTRVLTLINQIESSGSLMTDVHSRVNHSTKVQAWHEQFHTMVEQLSVSELVNAEVRLDEAHLDAKLLIYVIEGLLAHPHKLQEREQIIDQTLKRILTK
jgi:AcrR family transcriptional regulator|tara:strand:- start:5485 stop:6090 length:606 start_codon:yes stop_codon:yes gene_type:complete